MSTTESIDAMDEIDREALARLAEVFLTREPLVPELAACMHKEGGLEFIRHPLCCELYFPGTEAMMNRCLAQTKERVAKAKEAGAWDRFVFAHARAFRFEALLSLRTEDVKIANALWWSLVGEVWRDCENPYINRDLWATLWRDPRPGKRNVMTYGDRRRYAALAKEDTVEVYRGVASPRGRLGLSWTLSEERATWFARYRAHALPGYVYAVRVPASAILAYMNSRCEEEVIVDPEALRAIPRAAFNRRPV